MPEPRTTTEEIIAAYQQTGSVWKAGRKLGLSGQTIHARLRALGYQIGNPWTEEETNRLSEMANQTTIGQIADELGRSYASIACKIHELGAGSRHGNRIKKKLPRGAGLDKISVKRHIKDLEASKLTITKYARQRGIQVDTLIRAIEKHNPEWWIEYRNAISELPESTCPNCENIFYPSNTRQRFCSRLCQGRYKTDLEYFGGKRKYTIGLSEGICQLCGNTPKKGLSSHHILGKENDQENNHLVALCSGCHHVITALGVRDFTETQWESLISLAYLRKHSGDSSLKDIVHITVNIDTYDYDEEY